MNDSGWNMYVFRDGRKNVSGTHLRQEVLSRLNRLSPSSSDDEVLSALIAAGELECALADWASPHLDIAMEITEALASRLMGQSGLDGRTFSSRFEGISVPASIPLAVAEGFAYYALHPFRFRTPVAQLASEAPVRVIGIRSIGTTLSAVLVALFATHGTSVERITVRPQGHPYDRKLELTSEQKGWLLRSPDALVIIVDEGPGLSGSSFLSVAEAVEGCGVDPRRIVMLGSRWPELQQMRAPNAAIRWERFRFLAAAPEPILPDPGCVDMSGGQWRRYFWTDFEELPAAWTQLEAAKYMTPDRSVILKFHGYGHFGESIAERACKSAVEGFAPGCFGIRSGFGKYEVLRGRHLRCDELDRDVIERAARYCAFRVREMAIEPPPASDLDAMVKWNWQCEFESELNVLDLPVEKPVVADARMLPHEWLRTENGVIVKLDGITHGDDHFFPGPCDIAWDLAGMIVEWEMDDSAAAELLDAYRRLSGDDAGSRIADYRLAYSVFRMGWSRMAAQVSEGAFDEKLLWRDYLRYRGHAQRANVARTSSVTLSESQSVNPALSTT